MRNWIVGIVSVLVFVLLTGLAGAIFARPQGVQAQFDLPHCKAGVHMISPSDEDFVTAAALVHAHGGEYCWTTIVFREDEMTTDNLQRIHNIVRENKLQIIHRLEKGFDDKGNWLMPTESTIQKFIDALSGINPSGRDIYVVLGNEPTHAVMCGGCTPQSFAEWTMRAVNMLHDAEDDLGVDIHVGMAGQDLASPQLPDLGLYDAGFFMDRMFDAEPDLLCEVDIWTSHNYPRSFVGPALATGRLSPRGYIWELSFAEQRARSECKEHVRNLPVFITETGYKTGPSGIADARALSETRSIIDLYQQDPRVHAFTFFAYRFCGEPFQSFALAGCDVAELNGVGQALHDAHKTAGLIRHNRKARTTAVCPEDLVENMDAECVITAENVGTDIWQDIGGSYGLTLIGTGVSEEPGSPRFSLSRFREVKPGEKLTATLTYNPGVRVGQHDLTIGLTQRGKLLLGLAQWKVEVFESPTLELAVEGIFGRSTEAENAQIQVLDQMDEIVYRTSLDIVDGIAAAGKVPGVTFGTCYRIVLLVDGNLPVQKACWQFDKGLNIIDMPRLLAVDRNRDGKLSLSDVIDNFDTN